MADFAWLIEAPGARYLAARELGHQYDFHWTDDANKALRFFSENQCDKVRGAIRQMQPRLFDFEHTLGNAWPRQHGYLSAADQAEARP